MPIANAYTMPPFGASGSTLHEYLLSAQAEGDSWLKAQKPAISWPGAVEMMSEGDATVEAASMSNTTYPKAKRIARELVASIASFKHAGEFKVLWDNALYDQAHLLSNLDANWEQTTNPGAAYRKGIQNGIVKGTGYFVEDWDPDFWGPGKGDIRLTAMDPEDVTFVQLPKDGDIQKAYMVILRYELPINLAKRIYGRRNRAFAEALVPDRETPSWIQKGLQKVQQFISPALRVAGRTGQNQNDSFPTVEIRVAYTLDDSINETFASVKMGTYGTNWSYTVPYVGQAIHTNQINDRTGEPFTRPAEPEECRLFPLRRYTIWSNTGICYDGSSPWWHGDAPVARLWFNDWPWQSLGGSTVADIRTMENAIVATMRNVDDAGAARLDPPIIYDDSLVSNSWAQAFNPRKAGARAAAPLAQGKPIELPVDPRYYDVPTWIPQWIEGYEARMDYLSGVKDLTALAKAKQVPGADTIEKLLEMAGPLVQDMVGALIEPLTQLGEWRKAYYFQFYNDARIIRTVGPDEFDPRQWRMMPDKLDDYLKAGPGLTLVDRYGRENAVSILTEGSFQFRPSMLGGLDLANRNEHLRRRLTEFRFEVTESGITALEQMTTKLFYMRLMEGGKFPLSWWTFAKIARIPNFGPPPEGTNTELERWVAQKQLEIDLQVELQMEVAEAMGGQMGPGAAGMPEAPASPQIGGSGGQRGRPNAWTRPPRMVQKDNGQRTTITTS